jgi:hypothetical protein
LTHVALFSERKFDRFEELFEGLDLSLQRSDETMVRQLREMSGNGKTLSVKPLSILILPMLLLLLVSLPVRASDALIYVEPQYNYYGVGESFTVEVKVDNMQSLYAWQVLLTFNSSVLNVLDAVYASDHVFSGLEYVCVNPVIDNVLGYVLHGACLLGPSDGVNGSGGLFETTFSVVGPGESTLKIDTEAVVPEGIVTLLLNSSIKDMAFSSSDGYHHNHFRCDVTGLNGKPDGLVNVRDIAYPILLYRTTPESSSWDPVADVNVDGIIDMRDIGTVVLDFGQHFP